jgi:DNA-binding CsgD family transcriptional regulator
LVTISGGALRQLSDGLAELYAPGALDYAARVVNLANRLVPADSCSYNHIGGGPWLVTWLVEPADAGVFPDGGQLLQQHLHEHPILAYVRATQDGRARRISDFLSDRQFRSLGLYYDFYRRRGVDYQTTIMMPAPGGGLIAVALNRQRHDFSDEDLKLFDLLRVHVGQAAAIALLTQPVLAAEPDAVASPLLTSRQTRILRLVADGQSDRGIARTLGISTRTVQAHLQHIYRTLDVASRTEAVARLRALEATTGLSRSGHRVRS